MKGLFEMTKLHKEGQKCCACGQLGLPGLPLAPFFQNSVFTPDRELTLLFIYSWNKIKQCTGVVSTSWGSVVEK